MKRKNFTSEITCRLPQDLRIEVERTAEARQTSLGEATRLLLYAGVELMRGIEPGEAQDE